MALTLTPTINPNHNSIHKTLTLSLSLSLTLAISLTHSRPVRAANYGRLWSGVVGGDFSQTDHILVILFHGSSKYNYFARCLARRPSTETMHNGPIKTDN